MMLVPYRVGSKFGYYSTINRKIVIPIQFDAAGFFKDSLATVRINDLWSVISESNEIVIPLEHQLLGDHFFENLIEFGNNGLFGFLDIKNNVKISPQFEYALPFHEGRAGIKLNNLWGFIDRSGKIVIEPKYDWVFNFENGFAKVQLNTWEGFIDRSGKEYFEE